MARKKSEQIVSTKPVRPSETGGTGRGTALGNTITAAKSQTSVSVMTYTEAHIRERAYYIYLERGGALGDPLMDWLQAEQELNTLEGGSGSVSKMTGKIR